MSDLPLATSLRYGLICRCPRCGKGKLFSGYLKVAQRCQACGLDLKFADSGDGPAIFIIFLVSPIVIVLWLLTDAIWHPAPYVHLMLWIPVTVILCLALLPPFKATMVALQFRHDAHEGRLG